MRRSKLQVNLEILKTLAENGKLNSTHITYHTYLNNKSVNECLDFLIENNLVKEHECKSRKQYEITNQGTEAIQLAHKLDKILHVFD
jgi:predicted transcriptional regulator